MLRVIGGGGLAALAASSFARSVAAVESDPLPRIVLEWLGAWSADDPASSLAALYAEDGSYGDVAMGVAIQAPEIEEYLRQYLNGMSLINRYPRTTFAVNGLAVAEQLYWATSTAFDADGGEFQVYAVTIFEYDDRALLRTTDYYDFSSIVAQLDLAPQIPYGDCKSG
jgi:hypothetical protein